MQGIQAADQARWRKHLLRGSRFNRRARHSEHRARFLVLDERHAASLSNREQSLRTVADVRDAVRAYHMLVTVNPYAVPVERWHTDPLFRERVLAEHAKIEPYKAEGFIADWP